MTVNVPRRLTGCENTKKKHFTEKMIRKKETQVPTTQLQKERITK
jgi:hypothetical protein